MPNITTSIMENWTDSDANDDYGLTVEPDYISKKTEKRLLEDIEQIEGWDTGYKRHRKHYGYTYGTRYAKTLQLAEPIPDWLRGIVEVIYPEANQVIINRYLPGEGIAPHVDADLFGDKIVTLSLGSGCRFNFNLLSGETTKSLYLEPRTLVTMEGASRWRYEHGIPARKTDMDNKGMCRPRGTRYSITLRKYVK